MNFHQRGVLVVVLGTMTLAWSLLGYAVPCIAKQGWEDVFSKIGLIVLMLTNSNHGEVVCLFPKVYFVLGLSAVV